jgi:hypothetical protein
MVFIFRPSLSVHEDYFPFLANGVFLSRGRRRRCYLAGVGKLFEATRELVTRHGSAQLVSQRVKIGLDFGILDPGVVACPTAAVFVATESERARETHCQQPVTATLLFDNGYSWRGH